MKRSITSVGLALALFSGIACSASPPNIILVLCDDLGFGDTGPTFQNARAARNDRARPAFSTPQLDRVAAEGMVLRNHYCAAPVCAPSRASLLLGVHQGHANVRDNQFDKALANNHTLATVLKQAGYATAAIGKWGLQGRREPPGSTQESNGGDPTTWPAYPTKRGFDFYFGAVSHSDGHFHYPKEDGRKVWENEREVSAALDLCYTTDLYTARAKKWISDHRAARVDTPFFLYLSYDTPHAKLQYPPCAYPDDGVRWTGHSGAMLNTATGAMDAWCDPDFAHATWDHDRDPGTPEVPWPDVQKRHATSVRRIDAAVGDLIQLLRELGIEKETLLVFTSDNGPAAESYLPKQPYAPTFFAGFGPFDGIKRDVLEGGVRIPTIVRWSGTVPGGHVASMPSGQWDWLPTFAELAGLPAPASSDGVSLVPTLTARGVQRPSTIYVEYFQDKATPAYTQFAPAHRGLERGQMQLVMEGRLTGIRYDIQSVDQNFEIYDVEVDPQQTNNLAEDPAFAAVQQHMKARVLQLRRPDRTVRRPYDDALIPPVQPADVVEGKIACHVYEGNWPWVPEFANLAPTRREPLPGIDLSACPDKDYIGAAFLGYFRAPADGAYTFSVASDGGAVLFLHDARVVDADFSHAGDLASGAIRLAAGWHPLRLYYRHATGGRKLDVKWTDSAGVTRPLTKFSLGMAPISAPSPH